MLDNLKAKGWVQATLLDENGNVKQQQYFENLVVTTGKSFIADRMIDGSETTMSHMAIGSSNTAPAIGNTTLGTESGRVALLSATNNAADVVYVATFPAGTGTGNVYECGLFNNVSGGTMLARSTGISLVKGSSDTLQITWTITLS